MKEEPAKDRKRSFRHVTIACAFLEVVTHWMSHPNHSFLAYCFSFAPLPLGVFALTALFGIKAALIKLHATIPIPIHLFGPRNFKRTYDAETDETGLIQIPHRWRQGRVCLPFSF